MSDRTTLREQLTLVGLGLRTNNAAEMSGTGKIAAAWTAFIDEHVQKRIVNQVHATATYAAYYDYASDEKGDYSFVLGAAVRDGTPAPSGMVSVVIPASKYAVFTAATPADVRATWERIWVAKLRRAYTGDLEVYRQGCEIDIYVAIK
jgi:predicted transcriptional regulator YdeE